MRKYSNVLSSCTFSRSCALPTPSPAGENSGKTPSSGEAPSGKSSTTTHGFVPTITKRIIVFIFLPLSPPEPSEPSSELSDKESFSFPSSSSRIFSFSARAKICVFPTAPPAARALKKWIQAIRLLGTVPNIIIFRTADAAPISSCRSDCTSSLHHGLNDDLHTK